MSCRVYAGMMHSLRALKHVENFLIRLFYTPNQESPAEKVQTASGHHSKVYKTIFPATQNSELWRELTESELLSALGRQEIRRRSRSGTRLAQNKP